jgi:hypothetical protein
MIVCMLFESTLAHFWKDIDPKSPPIAIPDEGLGVTSDADSSVIPGGFWIKGVTL